MHRHGSKYKTCFETLRETKLFQPKAGREMKRVAHRGRVIAVEVVVEPVVVPVPPVTVPVEVTDIQLAVGIAEKIYKAPSVTPPLEFSRG